eukprot:m.243281 g.243281  ORF g.243281 m.243281 type:complete len:84 (+) comp40237_c0_seq64:123-374(+)
MIICSEKFNAQIIKKPPHQYRSENSHSSHHSSQPSSTPKLPAKPGCLLPIHKTRDKVSLNPAPNSSNYHSSSPLTVFSCNISM